MLMVKSDIDIGTDDEHDNYENDCEDLDEDVLSGLLGLTEMSAINQLVFWIL
jgi:hypothetical protein